MLNTQHYSEDSVFSDTLLDILFSYTEKEHVFSDAEQIALIQAIDSCKIIDPACGSGAFPMGILHKLVYILHKLDPYNEKWKERQIAKAQAIDDAQLRSQIIHSIEESFEHNELDYGRKLYLIENCIYGVDVQPIAVQISKLRFFISLVVDQRKQIKLENLGIRSLPNLETKFVSANTLVGLEKPSLQTNLFENADILRNIKALKEIRHKYFSANTRKIKLEYQKQDREIREKIAKFLEKSGWKHDTAEQIVSFDPYNQNISNAFFDPEWMFGLTQSAPSNGVFDIVIGNPPYLESRHPSFSDYLKSAYQKHCGLRWGSDASLITKGADLLVYFFEASLKLIKNNGNVVLITQNAWLDTEYGIKTQKFLIRHTNVKKVIDSKFRYFPAGEGPNINTVITVFQGNVGVLANTINFCLLKENIQNISLDSFISSNVENDTVKINRFNYSDAILSKYKWGILHNSDTFILEILSILEKSACAISKIRSSSRYSFGQGLNLSKACFVPAKVLKNYSISKDSSFPILYSGAPYQLKKSDWFLIRKDCIDKNTLKNIKSEGYDVFDPDSTRKEPPVLIMPRGISKHFCSRNRISAYSLSGVDVYSSSKKADGIEIDRLWLFFNSSIFWLLREISGRKNLGGGLLKSEAADLDAFPVYFDIDVDSNLVSDIERDVYDTLTEINSPEHRKIDKIIFDALGFNTKYREKCCEYLSQAIKFRSSKSTT